MSWNHCAVGSAHPSGCKIQAYRATSCPLKLGILSTTLETLQIFELEREILELPTFTLQQRIHQIASPIWNSESTNFFNKHMFNLISFLSGKLRKKSLFFNCQTEKFRGKKL